MNNSKVRKGSVAAVLEKDPDEIKEIAEDLEETEDNIRELIRRMEDERS